MRKIKFRGKRHYDGEWVYGYPLIADSEKYKSVNIVTLHEAYPDTLAKVTTSVEFNTLGQFTGLANRSGKEIYEGDILKMGNCDFRGVVQWHKNGYFYINEYYPKVIDDDYSPLGNMLRYDMDVIGNVFDNPELMKGGQK